MVIRSLGAEAPLPSTRADTNNGTVNAIPVAVPRWRKPRRLRCALASIVLLLLIGPASRAGP